MIEEVLENLGSLSQGLDGDWSDRVNYFFSSRLFLVLGTLVVTRQFVGESIICWSPNEFNSQWQSYVDAYCWVMNTNYLPLDSHHDVYLDGYAPRLIRYYQWTPLILFSQALMFLVPNFLWQTAYRSSGMDFERVVEFASRFETMIVESEWKTTIYRLARHIDRYLQLQKEYRPTWCARIMSCISGRLVFAVSRQYGNFLTYVYPTIKLCYIFNIILQFYVLVCWLGPDYASYGLDFLQSFFASGFTRDNFSASLFPRVTWCEVPRRLIEKKLDYQMHCVLPINLFNEIIFLVVWYWLAGIFLLSVWNFFRWLSGCSFQGSDYIKRHLHMTDRQKYTKSDEKKLVRKFIKTYLKSDGIFIIRLLSKNTSSIFISDLLTELYEIFKNSLGKSNNVKAENYLRGGLTSDDENDMETDTPLDTFMYPAGEEVKSRWGNMAQQPVAPPLGHAFYPQPPPPPPHSPGLNDFQLLEGRRLKVGNNQSSQMNVREYQ